MEIVVNGETLTGWRFWEVKQVYEVGVEPTLNRSGLKERYAIGYRQLGRRINVVGVIPPPAGKEFKFTDMCNLDLLHVAVKSPLPLTIQSYESEIVNAGKTLEEWVEENYQKTLLTYLLEKLEEKKIETDPAVEAVIRRLKQKSVEAS